MCSGKSSSSSSKMVTILDTFSNIPDVAFSQRLDHSISTNTTQQCEANFFIERFIYLLQDTECMKTYNKGNENKVERIYENTMSCLLFNTSLYDIGYGTKGGI